MRHAFGLWGGILLLAPLALLALMVLLRVSLSAIADSFHNDAGEFRLPKPPPLQQSKEAILQSSANHLSRSLEIGSKVLLASAALLAIVPALLIRYLPRIREAIGKLVPPGKKTDHRPPSDHSDSHEVRLEPVIDVPAPLPPRPLGNDAPVPPASETKMPAPPPFSPPPEVSPPLGFTPKAEPVAPVTLETSKPAQATAPSFRQPDGLFHKKDEPAPEPTRWQPEESPSPPATATSPMPDAGMGQTNKPVHDSFLTKAPEPVEKEPSRFQLPSVAIEATPAKEPSPFQTPRFTDEAPMPVELDPDDASDTAPMPVEPTESISSRPRAGVIFGVGRAAPEPRHPPADRPATDAPPVFSQPPRPAPDSVSPAPKPGLEEEPDPDLELDETLDLDEGNDPDEESYLPPLEHDSSPLPPLSILGLPEDTGYLGPDREELHTTARLLEQKLEDFKVKGQIIDAHPGPVITTYELDPAPGLRAAKVIGLADDLARSISAASVRVVGNIPGKNVIGIEIPNQVRRTVYLREILDSDTFRQVKSPLAMALGSDINGRPVVGNLGKMPHLLVAGTTGSGKSVAVNAMICSVLFSARPEEVRFLMVDPKMLELSIYEGIPHLLAPVVTDVNKAATLLKWAVAEMEERYRLMSELGVRNLSGYNQRIQECLIAGEEPTRRVKVGFDPETGRPVEQEEPIPLEKKPLIVIIIDELADLMIQVGKDVEPAIARLAQMARAAGLHLIIATQRPSVDVITGLIKANFPTRLAFQVSSKIDSRTILDSMGADRLLGMGDGLFQPPGTTHLQRIHAPFVSDSEVHKLVKFLKSTGRPEYDHSILESSLGDDGDDGLGDPMSDEYDPLYDQAAAVVIRAGKVSTSMVQRHFKIGYNRAARIVERMALDGLISEPNHAGKREVLAPNSGGR
ncbi:MAG: DNA translocase FtsK [Magnetococcales bacterium]|nr:DNA translocase FtsK [Magnetococcales bacterium]